MDLGLSGSSDITSLCPLLPYPHRPPGRRVRIGGSLDPDEPLDTTVWSRDSRTAPSEGEERTPTVPSPPPRIVGVDESLKRVQTRTMTICTEANINYKMDRNGFIMHVPTLIIHHVYAELNSNP